MIETDEAKRARLRKLWKAFWTASEAQRQQWDAIDQAYSDALRAWRDSDAFPFDNQPVEPRRPPSMPFPDELRGLTCGAKTRAGTPCRLTEIFRNGRCKFHGGASTGPRTDEGKAIAKRNARKRTP